MPKSLARACHESIPMESADKRNYIATIAGCANQQLSVQCVGGVRMTACGNMHHMRRMLPPTCVLLC